MSSRRTFLNSVSLGTLAMINAAPLFGNSPDEQNKSRIACQQYTWFTYFQREGKEWMKDPEASFKDYIKSGLTGYEPSFSEAAEVTPLQNAMKSQSVWAKSMYVNSSLYEEELVETSIRQILAIASEAKKIGIDILVTNPTPIRWGGPENKNDRQLMTQADALNSLGKALKSLGLTLAYHNHDAEMRESAREFHHMLAGTDPAFVKLCLDAHWIYRGSGNSQVALFDIVELYADRIVELHLRQSHDGIWSEVFGSGDIDYSRLAMVLEKKRIKPHIVLEQAIEKGTPHTMDTVEALSKSLENVMDIFKG